MMTLEIITAVGLIGRILLVGMGVYGMLRNGISQISVAVGIRLTVYGVALPIGAVAAIELIKKYIVS